MFLLFLSCSILNCRGTIFFSQISNLFFCDIFKHNCFAAVKEIHKLQFWLTTTSADIKLPLPKPSKYWKMDHYQDSADCGEVYLDSGVNILFSGNLRQSATVPSQCEWYTWTWTWCLLYFDSWYHFKNNLILFILFWSKKYHCNKGLPICESFLWNTFNKELIIIGVF